MLTVDCTCSGAGQCPLRGREVTTREYQLCKCIGDDKRFYEPTRCLKRRIRWINERRVAEGLKPLVDEPIRQPEREKRILGKGPGTHLKEIFAAFGIEQEQQTAAGCASCNDLLRAMDAWGVEGCIVNRDEILRRLREKYRTVTWTQAIAGTLKAGLIGQLFPFNPLDPVPGFLNEALERAMETRPSKLSLPCIYRGQRVRKLSLDAGGTTVFHCGVHHECTVLPTDGMKDCFTCTDRVATRNQPVTPVVRETKYSESQKRHLAFHLYVTPNGVWRRSIDQLALRKELFNGKKVIAVASDGQNDAVDYIHEKLGENTEVVTLANVASLREVASWVALWERILTVAGRDDAVLYAQGKGATRKVDPGNACQWWASMLYHISLDYWPVVARQLLSYPITGAFKKIGFGFGSRYGNWHYSGSFYWVRMDDFRNWRNIPYKWFGVEAWPGMSYPAKDAGCIFHEGAQPTVDLYRPQYWTSVVIPQFKQWAKENVDNRTVSALRE